MEEIQNSIQIHIQIAQKPIEHLNQTAQAICLKVELLNAPLGH